LDIVIQATTLMVNPNRPATSRHVILSEGGTAPHPKDLKWSKSTQG
jgi:hypothetical protein